MERIVGYLGLFMSAFFVAAGIFFIWKQPLGVPVWFSSLQGKPHVFNIIVGILPIVYGIFRFFRSYKIVTERD